MGKGIGGKHIKIGSWDEKALSINSPGLVTIQSSANAKGSRDEEWLFSHKDITIGKSKTLDFSSQKTLFSLDSENTFAPSSFFSTLQTIIKNKTTMYVLRNI